MCGFGQPPGGTIRHSPLGATEGTNLARREFSLRHREGGSAERPVSADSYHALAPERGDRAPDAALLVPRAAAGDRSAWEALVDQYSRLIWAVTRDFRLPESDAADVVQSTWLRLLEHISRIEYPDRIASWLTTTARHECLRHLAAARRVTLVDGDSTAFEATAAQLPGVDERLLAAEQAGAVRDAMSKLPSRSQQLLELLMADPPVSYLEISDQLGLPIGSIGPTRGRCLERLRLMLQTSLARSTSGVSRGSTAGSRWCSSLSLRRRGAHGSAGRAASVPRC